VIALYPLAIACAAIAAAALRTAALPRWLAAGAALTALALAVNGTFLEASFVPARPEHPTEERPRRVLEEPLSFAAIVRFRAPIVTMVEPPPDTRHGCDSLV
jgi:hypothetical protein